MKQSHRLALAAIAEVFDPAGVKWRTVKGGKHLCVVMTAPDGTEHKLAISGSPADIASAASFKRQDAVRLLERLGINQNRSVQGQCTRHRPKGPPPPRVTVLSFERPQLDAGPYRDPWAVLREGLSNPP